MDPIFRPFQSRVVAGVAGSASGLLYWSCIPPTDILLAAWICLIPCFVAAFYLPMRALVSAAAVAGIVSGLGRVYWIADTLVQYGEVPELAALITNGLLILYLGLYWIGFFWFCAKIDVESVLFPWIAASAWVFTEWLQSWVISGFPWALLGYSLHRSDLLLQSASLAGIYGLSFIVVLVNATLFQLIVVRYRYRERIRGRLSGPLWHVLLAPSLFLVGALLYGGYRTQGPEQAPGSTLKIGIVQGNVTQDWKWKPDHLQLTVSRYIALTRELASESDFDLIIYPETALPMYFRDPLRAPYARQVTALARELQTPLLVGSLEGSRTDPDAEVFNRAFLVDGLGEIVDHADKVHLVPFGEYMPLPFIFEYLDGLTAESGRFTAGAEHRTVTLDGEEFGVFICFEAVFPEITRALVQRGATVLVNMTNDAWFGRSAAPYQHFAMAVVRAVETGRPVVRAANTGISGLVTARGEVVATSALFATTTMALDVSPGREITPYVRFGDTFVALCAGLLLFSVWRLRDR